MNDPQLRILRAAARHGRRRLEFPDPDAAAGKAATASTGRRLDLSERAARTRSWLAAAAARRRLVSTRPGAGGTDAGGSE